MKFRLAEHAEGFVALAATFLAYGLTELVNGYGFIAVFVCACAIRASERHHGYHRVLHSYVEQGERMLTVLIIFLLGGAAATGLSAGVAWHEILTAAVILLVVRPLAGWLGLLRSRATSRERLVIAFFGVRGVGSLFYITYALQAGRFADPAAIWRIVGLVVVGSIMVHGLSASPIMYLLDRGRARTPQPSREATTNPADLGKCRGVAACRPGTPIGKEVREMPQKAWSAKRERQYKHIKSSAKDQGASNDRAEEIAARIVNKNRAQSGESKQASRTSVQDKSE